MSTAYEASCHCGYTERYLGIRAAQRALRVHVCPPPVVDWDVRQRCGCCGCSVWLTVDDSGLCVRCDWLIYPNAVA